MEKSLVVLENVSINITSDPLLEVCTPIAAQIGHEYAMLTSKWLAWFAILGFLTACLMFFLIWLIRLVKEGKQNQ